MVKKLQQSQSARWRIRVRGIVQGVGFRPFIYGLAIRLNLSGFVRNDSEGVQIEIEGMLSALELFSVALASEKPPLAQINAVEILPVAAIQSQGFAIIHSATAQQRATLIAPDSATCPDCMHELFDPTDRRYRYPFLNCTNCGPRFTIVHDVPYDRVNTTMQHFPMCPQCRAEYDDPLNRRFHAQPNACPICGPTLELWIGEGISQNIAQSAQPLSSSFSAVAKGDAALCEAVRLLVAGQILAVKGLGGYHLVCNGWNAQAVATLRRRKRREAKPFAIMVSDIAAAQQLCQLQPPEIEVLTCVRRPIVLLEQHPHLAIPADLAPGYSTLGVMLPYTPLHHLLLQGVTEAQGSTAPAMLVMTSGNVSDEPIAYLDSDAYARLATIADAIVSHDRAIETRCDDSVTRIVAGGVQFLRRSRGYAPEPLQTAFAFQRPILAYGGHLTNTFCLARGHQAFMSQHIGDLDNLEVLVALREGINHFKRLFDIVPEVIAYDLHPEYLATKDALAADIALKVGVQHHHAHIASVIVEHGLEGPVIGIAADGTGYGLDGAIWGGEVLIASLETFTRVGHLAYIPLPGGDQAIRQPWRVAAVYLDQAYGPDFVNLPIAFTQSFDLAAWRVLRRMIERSLNTPRTSSIGRLFDAVAALIGLRNQVIYEGQAAIELERLAELGLPAYPYTLSDGTPFQIDILPMIRAIVDEIQAGVGMPQIAGRFHQTVAAFFVASCQRVRETTGLTIVALSGGVFQNRLLLETLTMMLQDAGFQVVTNRRVPPNDGGLSLGQAAIAATIVAGRV